MPATEFSESLLDPVYISEKYGNDEIGDGPESNSFKTILRSMRYVGRESFPSIYQDTHEDGKKFEIISKWQIKKAQKIWARKEYKNVDKQRKLLEDEGKRLKNLEEAEAIATQEDSGTCKSSGDSINRRDRRVKLFGT